MSKVLEVFDGKTFQPILTEQHLERVVETANKNKIDLI